MRIRKTQDVERLRPLFEQWRKTCLADEFNMDTNVDVILAGLAKGLATREGAILIAEDGDEIIGFLAMFVVQSDIGKDTFALQRYWYAGENTKLCGAHLFAAAKEWAIKQHCSHMIMDISQVASRHAERAARFCSKVGMKLLETSWICDLSGA